MGISINKVDSEAMSKKGGSFKKTWNHADIQEFLNNSYDQLAEEDGESVTLEFSEEEFYNEYVDNDLSYKDYVNEKEHPHPTVKSQIGKNLEEAGFSDESSLEDRKSAVGGHNTSDGYTIIVELNPAE